MIQLQSLWEKKHVRTTCHNSMPYDLERWFNSHCQSLQRPVSRNGQATAIINFCCLCPVLIFRCLCPVLTAYRSAPTSILPSPIQTIITLKMLRCNRKSWTQSGLIGDFNSLQYVSVPHLLCSWLRVGLGGFSQGGFLHLTTTQNPNAT